MISKLSLHAQFASAFIIYLIFFFSFISFMCCQNTQNDTIASVVLFGTKYLPGNDCNKRLNSNFTGKEWYIIKYAYDYINNEKYSIECYSDRSKEDIPSALIAAKSWTIIARALRAYNMSQPTRETGLSIIKKYPRPPWLFFLNLSRVAFFLIFIIFPLMTGIGIWIVEGKAFSLDIYLIEMIITYFYYSETRINQTPGRIICWGMHFVALVVFTMYTGSLVERYQNYKSFDGLTDPGGLYNIKIRSMYQFKYIEPHFSILAYSDGLFLNPNDLKELFSNETTATFLGDSEFVENFAASTCDVYTVISNWIKVYCTGLFGINVTSSEQRIWNEAITKSTENLSPKDIDRLYDHDPLAIKPIVCKGKYNFNANTYILTDFYELWIIYVCGIVVAVIFKILSCVKNKISLKFNEYVRSNVIRNRAEKLFCFRIKKTFVTYLLISLISMTAQLDSYKNKIKKYKKYQSVKRAKKMNGKIKKSFVKSITSFAKKKLRISSFWKVLLHNESFKKKRIQILKKQSKFTRRKKILQPFYLQNLKKKKLILSLGFDHFLRQLFITNFTSHRLEFVKKMSTESQFIIIYLPYCWGTSFSLKTNEFMNINHCSSTIFRQYFDPHHLKLNVLKKSDRDNIQKHVDDLITQKIIQAKSFEPFEVAAKIRKIISTKIKRQKKKNFIEKFQKDVVGQINKKSYFSNKPFLDLDPVQQKAIYKLTKKMDLKDLKITHDIDKFVIKLPNNYGELVYKKPRSSLFQNVYVEEPHSNFIKNTEYTCQHLKQLYKRKPLLHNFFQGCFKNACIQLITLFQTQLNFPHQFKWIKKSYQQCCSQATIEKIILKITVENLIFSAIDYKIMKKVSVSQNQIRLAFCTLIKIIFQVRLYINCYPTQN